MTMIRLRWPRFCSYRLLITLLFLRKKRAFNLKVSTALELVLSLSNDFMSIPSLLPYRDSQINNWHICTLN